MAKLLFTRHGTTLANIDNRFAGRTAEPLHQQGIAQMEKLAGELQSQAIHRIFCGPLPRTRQSADILAARLGVEVVEEENFNEIDLPHWDGLSKEAITHRFGPQYPTWLSAPDQFQVFGCETLSQVQNRAVAAATAILQEDGDKTCLLVSHLIVGRCLALHFTGQPMSRFREIKIANGSIISLFEG